MTTTKTTNDSKMSYNKQETARLLSRFKSIHVKCPKDKKKEGPAEEDPKSLGAVTRKICNQANTRSKNPSAVSVALWPEGSVRCPEFCSTQTGLRGKELLAQKICNELKQKCGSHKYYSQNEFVYL